LVGLVDLVDLVCLVCGKVGKLALLRQGSKFKRVVGGMGDCKKLPKIAWAKMGKSPWGSEEYFS